MYDGHSSLIHAEDISKVDGENTILSGISLQIRRGERVAILGKPGSGKTALFEVLAGLEPYTSGSLSINGNPIGPNSSFDSTIPIRLNNIGLLFQEFHLIPNNTVYENIAVPLLLKSYSLEQSRPLVENVLAELGIEELVNAMPESLSDENKQLVALARAIVHSPNIILADEPTGNLNSNSAERILELLHTTLSKRHCALLLATQSVNADVICTTRYTMENGCLAVNQ